MKNIINKTLAKTTGYYFTRHHTKQQKMLEAQARWMSKDKLPVIFDVGAYTGETALAYQRFFNNRCEIHSFEPFEDSFKVLNKQIASYDNIHCYNFALGDKSEATTFHVNNFTATNSILPSSEEGKAIWGAKTLDTKAKIEVPMVSIDDFVAENKIDQIDILKMDVQGAEYLVMEGAKQSIQAGKIKIIFTELITTPIYEGQKAFHENLAMYENLGFELYDLFKSNGPDGRLRFMDGVFVYKH